MTNPNDIIDAYEELRRLAAIVDADTLYVLVDRAIARPARLGFVGDGIKPPASLQLVGEQDPEPVTLATGGIIDTRFTVLQGEPGRVIGEIEVLEVGTPPVAGDNTASDSDPALTATGCPWCGLDIGKNTMFRHLNHTHRDDLEQLYVDDGIKGLQTVFGVPYGTAWNWGRKLDGEAA